MNRFLWRRTVGSAMILGTVLAAGARAQMTPSIAAGADAIAWVHLEPGCQASPPDVLPTAGDAPRILSCGASGSFVFGKPGLRFQGGCRSSGVAVETPAILPSEQTPFYPPALPCSQGSCDHRVAGLPWVAVVDWPTEHGWSVEATIREASDQRVETELFDLTGNGALAQWAPSVSDLHVLAQLCAVAEAVQAHPDDLPLAVNMSFGRLLTEPACGDSGPKLRCAVSRVLSDLAGAGVLPVAAAGNDHEMLFPASSPGVVSAGALDLSRFEMNQDVRPSAQTPDGAAALMLGYGLYLSADGNPPYWSAPPGSSYATALLTGWLGGTLAKGNKLPDPPLLERAHWRPLPVGGSLALALNGTALPGSALNGPRLLLDRAMHTAGSAHDPKSNLTLAFQGTAPTPPELSVLHADSGYGPQPGVDPCVPCSGGPPGRVAGSGSGGVSLTLDLSSSGALPPQMELLCLFLRIGKSAYAFVGSCDPAVLAPIASGSLASLTLSEIDPTLLQAGDQPSLYLVVNVGGPAYWHELPIHLAAPAP